MSSVYCFAILLLTGIAIVNGDDALDDAMEATMKKHLIRGASIAVFVRDNHTEPVVRGYGHVASGDESPQVTPDTNFMIQSISKVFTGSVVSILLDQGIIDTLDDDICDVVLNQTDGWTEEACRNPMFPDIPVTWRMLVTHSSSLVRDVPCIETNHSKCTYANLAPENAYFDSAQGNPTCPLEDVVGFYRDVLNEKETETLVGSGVTAPDGEKLNWYQGVQDRGGTWQDYEPGTKVRYSNFAFGYIVALVEMVTDQKWSEFCRENLFEPLEMNNTAWSRRNLPLGTLEAVPVEYHSGKWVDHEHYCMIEFGDGGVRTSASDLTKWCQAMLSFGSPILWSEVTGKNAFACQTPTEDCWYGVGWERLENDMKDDPSLMIRPWDFLRDFRDFDWTNGGHHGGSNLGYRTNMIVLPSAGVFVVVLANTNDFKDDGGVSAMTRSIMQTLGYSGCHSSWSSRGPLVILFVVIVIVAVFDFI